MKKNSFLTRLIVSFLVIAVLPLALITTLYLVNTTRVINQTTRQRLDTAADQVQTQLDSLLNHMSFISVSLISNENFIESVVQLESTDNPVLQRESYAQVYAEICSYAWFSTMYDVSFFNDSGHVITSYSYNEGYNYTYRMNEADLEKISWYDRVQNNYGEAVIVPVQNREFPIQGEACMSIARAIRNPGKTVGYLRIDIGARDLNDLLGAEGTIDAELLILDRDGTVVYQSENFPMNVQNPEEDLAQLEKSHFVEQRSGMMNTRVYMTLAKKTAYKELYNTLAMLGIQILIMLCLTGIVVLIFVKDLSRPLVSLRREMAETTLSNLQDRGNEKLFNRFEEIDYLYRQFHQMRERLDVMVQQEMENKTMYLEERMNYLQTQINPHFMCNTLNVIGIMGSEHGAQDIQDACVQLSSLLRYSIADSDENKTTLQEEMQNIRDYLQLMRLRYEHKLVYRVDYDEKMQHMSMPRLVLEPFVENIFAHAYGPQHKIVHVEVSAWQTQQRWYISIKDNGQGVEQEKLQQMRQHIRDGCRQILAGKRVEKRFGIGVENTIMRLCLFYGDSFQFDLISQPGEGLQITLSAEKEKENQYETDKRIDSGR